MEKKNRHSWEPVKDSKKLKHKECIHCHLEKWWDAGFGRLIYQDAKGNIYYRTPSCTHIAKTTHHKKPIVTPYYN